MKTIKQLLSLFLVAAMLISLSAVFAEENGASGEDGLVYVSIGDSIASGLGLPDYYDENGTGRHNVEIKGSFPSLVSEGIHADRTEWLANPGYRTNELYVMLSPEEDPYYGDFITYTVMPSMTHIDPNDLPAMIAQTRPIFQNAVQEADVITINLGSNNMMMRLMAALFKIAWGMDMEAMVTGQSNPTGLEGNKHWQKLKELVASAGSEIELMNQVMSLLDSVEQTTGAVDTIVGALKSAQEDFRTYYAKSIERIYELNPDVTVIAVGLYNPLRDSKLFEGGTLSVGKIIDPIMRYMNSYLEFGAPHSSDDNYIYVDAWNAEVIHTLNLDEIDVNDQAFFSKISSYIHPNENGHAYMAEQILDAYYDRSIPFSDVDRSTENFEEIAYCYQQGYLTGITTHTFAPNMNINRGMLAATLYKHAGMPSFKPSNPFKDVSSNSYYSRGIAWLYSQGITAGVNYSLFSPMTNVKTQDLAVMLYNYAKCPKTKTDLSTYSDAKKVSLYARKAMSWAAENDLIDTADGTLHPSKAVTRSELAYALSHFDAME